MFHKNTNELAYPFLYDPVEDLRCDFEILSDELCSWFGMIQSLLAQGDPLRDEMGLLMRKCYDLNGSLRGRMAIGEEDLAYLSAKCDEYSIHARQTGPAFVLPAGHPAACAAHIARTRAKALVRLLYRERERPGGGADERLIRYANLLANYLFLLSLRINAQQGIPETPFHSQSYGTDSP